MDCERGGNNKDAVLWKREEIIGQNHKVLWFEGKNWSENCSVFIDAWELKRRSVMMPKEPKYHKGNGYKDTLSINFLQ